MRGGLAGLKVLGKPGFGFAVGGGLTRPELERGIKVQEVGSKVE